MSLSKAIVYLRGMHKGQQLYVAVSRVQTLQGLKIEGSARELNRLIASSSEVDDFYNTLQPVSRLEGLLPPEDSSERGKEEEEYDDEEDEEQDEEPNQEDWDDGYDNYY